MAASTQNQALAALLFVYEHVLERPLDRVVRSCAGPQAEAATGGADGMGDMESIQVWEHTFVKF